MMAGRTNERENGLPISGARLNRDDRAPGSAPRCSVRARVYDGVTGGKISRVCEAGCFALDELEILCGMNALDLRVSRVARRNSLGE